MPAGWRPIGVFLLLHPPVYGLNVTAFNRNPGAAKPVGGHARWTCCRATKGRSSRGN